MWGGSRLAASISASSPPSHSHRAQHAFQARPNFASGAQGGYLNSAAASFQGGLATASASLQGGPTTAPARLGRSQYWGASVLAGRPHRPCLPHRFPIAQHTRLRPPSQTATASIHTVVAFPTYCCFDHAAGKGHVPFYKGDHVTMHDALPS